MNEDLTHRIRQRAYEIWATNGYRDGEAEQHWLTAEREVLSSSMGPFGAKRSAAKKPSRAASRGMPKKAVAFG